MNPNRCPCGQIPNRRVERVSSGSDISFPGTHDCRGTFGKLAHDGDITHRAIQLSTLDLLKSDPDQAIVTFDFANIGPEDRPFNESWESH